MAFFIWQLYPFDLIRLTNDKSGVSSTNWGRTLRFSLGHKWIWQNKNTMVKHRWICLAVLGRESQASEILSEFWPTEPSPEPAHVLLFKNLRVCACVLISVTALTVPGFLEDYGRLEKQLNAVSVVKTPPQLELSDSRAESHVGPWLKVFPGEQW